MVNECGITPVILLSKCDLVSEHEIVEMENEILSIAPQVSVLTFSNLTGKNIDTIRNFLIRGKTYCLLGSSGVGKTTLLNTILGSQRFETQSVSKKENKGRHTPLVANSFS